MLLKLTFNHRIGKPLFDSLDGFLNCITLDYSNTWRRLFGNQETLVNLRIPSEEPNSVSQLYKFPLHHQGIQITIQSPVNSDKSGSAKGTFSEFLAKQHTDSDRIAITIIIWANSLVKASHARIHFLIHFRAFISRRFISPAIYKHNAFESSQRLYLKILRLRQTYKKFFGMKQPSKGKRIIIPLTENSFPFRLPKSDITSYF